MAKGIYVGAQTIQGDIIPKTWTGSEYTYTSSNGVEISCSEFDSSHMPYKASDGDDDTFWEASLSRREKWIKLNFPQSVKITKMNILAQNGYSVFTSAKLQGSNDDNSWVDLYDFTNTEISYNLNWVEFTLNNADYYKQYRIYVNYPDNLSSSNGIEFRIYEWLVTEYASKTGVACKVKKAYVGVSEAEKLVEFTSNPMPTTWTDSSDYLSATATNEYGEWQVEASSVYTQSYKVSIAFDGKSGSAYGSKELSEDNEASYLYLNCPTGVSINPSSIKINHSRNGNSTYQSKIQAYNGSEWVDIGTMQIAYQSTKYDTLTVTGDTYYSAFRAVLYRYSSSYNIAHVEEFEITSGTLKIPAKSNIARKIKKGYIGVAEDSLVANGDFSNGLEGWTQSGEINNSIYSVANNIVSISYTSVITDKNNSAIVQTVACKKGHKYYMSTLCKAQGTAHINFYSFAPVTLTQNQWELISGIETVNADTNVYFVLGIKVGNGNNATVGDNCQYAQAKLYDLTEMFGAGNEPTKEWCDANLAELKTLYKSQNSKARLFYVAETLIPFTSSPVPTTWNVTDNYTAVASNNYGTWNISATSASKPVSSAFDSDSSTYWASTGTTYDGLAREVILELPTNVSIKPIKIFLTHRYCGGTSHPAKIQGYDGNEWIDLGTLTRYDFKLNQEFEISTDTYFTKFKVQTYRYNGNLSSSEIYDFKITSGTLKIEE